MTKPVKFFYVYRDEDGGQWLADDEHGWTSQLGEAVSFTSAELARDIGRREDRQGLGVFVMEMISAPADADAITGAA